MMYYTRKTQCIFDATHVPKVIHMLLIDNAP